MLSIKGGRRSEEIRTTVLSDLAGGTCTVNVGDTMYYFNFSLIIQSKELTWVLSVITLEMSTTCYFKFLAHKILDYTKILWSWKTEHFLSTQLNDMPSYETILPVIINSLWSRLFLQLCLTTNCFSATILTDSRWRSINLSWSAPTKSIVFTITCKYYNHRIETVVFTIYRIKPYPNTVNLNNFHAYVYQGFLWITSSMTSPTHEYANPSIGYFL